MSSKFSSWLVGRQAGTQSDDSASTPQSTFTDAALSYGLQTVSEGVDPIVDIVAVHGLNGHREKTWTAANGIHWLRDLLPNDLPRARILCWGYNANIHASSIVNSQYMYNHALNLVADLLGKRKATNSTERPIIFVAHSLGGIIVKSALIHSATCRQGALHEYHSVKVSTHGIIFMGTPHQGGDGFQLGRLLTDIASVFIAADDLIIENLKRDSEWLQQKLGQYDQISSDFVTAFVYEAYETPTVVGHKILVVPRVAAVPSKANGESFAVHANHINMVKFLSKDDNSYSMVSVQLQIMVSTANDRIRSQWEAEIRDFRIPFNHQKWPNSIDACSLSNHVLYGLGGIGKTQLALAFTRRHQALFSCIFWLDGRSESRLRQSIAGYASRIPEAQVSDRSKNLAQSDIDDLDVAIADVLDWLERPGNDNWLLVFDNVDQDYEQGGVTGAYDIRQYILGNHGSVLITTRQSRLAKLDTDYEELFALLDGLPLAIAQAASYLRETGLNPASYVQLYREQWEDLMRSHVASLMDYEQQSVATTWMVSFKAVEARSKNAVNLLLLWAFIDNNDLWHGLLRMASESGEHLPEWLREMAGEEVIFIDAATLLLRYSMIEPQHSVRGSYAMHPVMHRWVLSIQDIDQRREFLWLAVVLVGWSVPSNATKAYWVLQRWLLPHAERCSWWMLKDINSTGVHFDDTLATGAICLLGNLFADQGRLKEAEEMYMRALAGREKALGRDHLSTLDTINNLGFLYSKQGRLKEADEMYMWALAGREKALGRDHLSTLDTINNLGLIYSDQGKLKEAGEMYVRALDGREKALGRDHLDTIKNLGLLYANQGRLKEAEEMYVQALVGREKMLGRDHPSTLETVNNLGLLYADQGKLKEAEEMYVRALAGREKSFGPEHTVTLKVCYNLGKLYFRQNKLEAAEVFYTRAKIGREKALEPGNTSTIVVMDDLEKLSRQQDVRAGAEASSRAFSLQKLVPTLTTAPTIDSERLPNKSRIASSQVLPDMMTDADSVISALRACDSAEENERVVRTFAHVISERLKNGQLKLLPSSAPQKRANQALVSKLKRYAKSITANTPNTIEHARNRNAAKAVFWHNAEVVNEFVRTTFPDHEQDEKDDAGLISGNSSEFEDKVAAWCVTSMDTDEHTTIDEPITPTQQELDE
ncbi:Kinesin light chain [Tolypocladium ophioglossoides CBS 100239]|uniref:Kinesin light chain n=1 Tax=Tolypocladium ophioglossoides (strain CBS 100239) TaxID=1163406 RepID=A0A0L0NIH1_TOLOC|nr:Kinesin light chain [Tolypocladium ophioglossoides CBS 100239]